MIQSDRGKAVMASRGVQLDSNKTRYLYRARGWSQRDLASNSGLDPRTVRKAVDGGSCDARTHLLIANALAVPPEELLNGRRHDASSGSDAQSSQPIAHRSSSTGQAASADTALRIELNWKIIDLRNSSRCLGTDVDSDDVVTVWDFYRVRKLRDEPREITFNYQTWGERIDCAAKPVDASWSCLPVRPGELYHSRERYELVIPLPDPPDATLDLAPIQLEFINAFEPPDNSFWQVHVAYPTDSLHIQVLFPKTMSGWSVTGFAGDLASRGMIPVPAGPVISPASDCAAWIISQPNVGAYFKTAWSSR